MLCNNSYLTIIFHWAMWVEGAGIKVLLEFFRNQQERETVFVFISPKRGIKT